MAKRKSIAGAIAEGVGLGLLLIVAITGVLILLPLIVNHATAF